MGRLPRIIGALTLLAVGGFCGFGFMATYEYTEPSTRLPWQIGYGVVGLLCLGGAVMALRHRPTKGGDTNERSRRTAQHE